MLAARFVVFGMGFCKYSFLANYEAPSHWLLSVYDMDTVGGQNEPCVFLCAIITLLLDWVKSLYVFVDMFVDKVVDKC